MYPFSTVRQVYRDIALLIYCFSIGHISYACAANVLLYSVRCMVTEKILLTVYL